tara:strand:+ start:140 stop:1555 length:1416 start_codon:yes stop_codon:yes gene_type:complete
MYLFILKFAWSMDAIRGNHSHWSCAEEWDDAELAQAITLLHSLNGLLRSDPVILAPFASSSYWETLCPRFHVSERASGPIREDDVAAPRWDTAAAEVSLNTVGFAVVPPPAAADPSFYKDLQHAIGTLEREGWPPSFIFVYDEVWAYVVFPLFDAMEALLPAEDGEIEMESDLNCWSLRRQGDFGTYVGANFGTPHRDSSHAHCHDAATGRRTALNAWVAVNPSGATLRNGCMRALPIPNDALFAQPADYEHMSLRAMRRSFSDDEAVAMASAAGDICTWVPCLIHWGGSCCADLKGSPEEEPRISIAATFRRRRRRAAPRGDCGGSDVGGGYGNAEGTRGPSSMSRAELHRNGTKQAIASDPPLSFRLAYAAKSLLNFAHWYDGFPSQLLVGDVQHARGQLDAALATYDAALIEMPHDEETLTSRAHVLLELGRAADAVAGYNAALALAPDDCDLIAFRDEAKAAASIES